MYEILIFLLYRLLWHATIWNFFDLRPSETSFQRGYNEAYIHLDHQSYSSIPFCHNDSLSRKEKVQGAKGVIVYRRRTSWKSSELPWWLHPFVQETRRQDDIQRPLDSRLQSIKLLYTLCKIKPWHTIPPFSKSVIWMSPYHTGQKGKRRCSWQCCP